MSPTRCPLLFGLVLLAAAVPALAQEGAVPDGFSRQDMLRGTVTAERAWWDVQHYELSLRVMPETKSIEGSNVITFKVVAKGDRMQVDLQKPLAVTRVVHDGAELEFEREGKVYWITFPQPLAVGTEHAVGLIALSHLSEHFKEWLEDQDKPAHHVQERHRLDVLRIFAGGKQPYWPRHILWYHDWWDGHRGDMGCFVHANVQAELKAADKKGGGGH